MTGDALALAAQDLAAQDEQKLALRCLELAVQARGFEDTVELAKRFLAFVRTGAADAN